MFIVKNGTLCLEPSVLATTIKNGVSPKLTSPEVITRAFLAAMFYKMKKDNLLPLSGQQLDESYPYRWSFMLAHGEVHMNPTNRMHLLLDGIAPSDISSETLTMLHLHWMLFNYVRNPAGAVPIFGKPKDINDAWALRAENGNIQLTSDVRDAIIESGVDHRATSPEILTKAFLATSLYKSRKGASSHFSGQQSTCPEK